MTNNEDPDIAAASHGVTNPATARGTISALYTSDRTILPRINRFARRAVTIRSAIAARLAVRAAHIPQRGRTRQPESRPTGSFILGLSVWRCGEVALHARLMFPYMNKSYIASG